MAGRPTCGTDYFLTQRKNPPRFDASKTRVYKELITDPAENAYGCQKNWRRIHGNGLPLPVGKQIERTKGCTAGYCRGTTWGGGS